MTERSADAAARRARGRDGRRPGETCGAHAGRPRRGRRQGRAARWRRLPGRAAAARRGQPRLRDAERRQAQRRDRSLERRTAASGCWRCSTMRTSGSSDRLGALRLGLGRAVRENPQLVVLSITDFGQTGPYRDWVATDAVLLAMGGVLSRSGLPGREPLMPPGEMALQLTAVQAAWAALVAYWNRLESGLGDHIDFSLYEATVQAIEPAMGTRRHRAGGRLRADPRPAGAGPVSDLPLPRRSCPGRAAGAATVACDARVAGRSARSCGIRSSRRSAAARSPQIGCTRSSSGTSQRAARTSWRARARREASRWRRCSRLADVLSAEHFRVRGTIARRELAPGVFADVPSGFAEIDGRRVRAAGRAPRVGEHDPGTPPRGRRGTPEAARIDARPRPLEGLRILDFGVIVFGAEVARLFCELGAEVIKVESRGFPDGARVSPVHFAIGHRGSKSLGVNLRSADGVEVIKRLVPHCDVVLSNFKPGTLEKLGLGTQTLRELNPRIVVVRSSALGASGPWREWMGYGPLVRCVTGLTSLWRYEDDQASFSDSTAIHPDHYAARLCAITTLAALIARRRSHRGAEIETSQAEAILTQIAPLLAASVAGAGERRRRPELPRGVYPCAGDDEWCVVTVRDDDDWQALRVALGDPPWAAAPRAGDGTRTAGATRGDRRAAGGVDGWPHARVRPRRSSSAHGVPAGFMQRPDEYEHDPHLRARDFLRTFEQPGLEPMRIENTPFRSERIPAPAQRPRSGAGRAHARDLPRAARDWATTTSTGSSRSRRSRSRPRSRRSRRSRRPEGRHERVGYRAILTRVLPIVSPASSADQGARSLLQAVGDRLAVAQPPVAQPLSDPPLHLVQQIHIAAAAEPAEREIVGGRLEQITWRTGASLRLVLLTPRRTGRPDRLGAARRVPLPGARRRRCRSRRRCRRVTACPKSCATGPLR